MIDNRTNEQIAENIYQREEAWAWALGRKRLVPMMVEAIETAGRLAGEPSDIKEEGNDD